MNKTAQRHSTALQPQIGTCKLLSPAWIEQTDDPDYAWEVPRHTVEFRIKDCVADQFECPGGVYDHALGVINDAKGRVYVVLSWVAASRRVIVAVPVQDEHGRIWLDESLAYGDFAVKVRRTSDGRTVTVYVDNAKRRQKDAKYDALLQEAATRELDSSPVDKTVTKWLAD